MRRLTQWGIVPASTYDFRIEGDCEKTGEFLTTANVHSRLSSTRIVCVDGRSYELVGQFNRAAGAEGYIPARILDAFVHGVPRNWRQVILGWSEQDANVPYCREAEITVKCPDLPLQRCSADSSSQKMQRGAQALQVGTPKPKANESTEALLAITARKGTLKRKAQIKKLADALAAKEACDDIYQSQALGENIPGDFFMTEKWDELSDFRASRMTTPVPNSPHLSPGKSQFSFSSEDSTLSESPVAPLAAVAIMQSLRKPDYATTLKSSTPKSKYMKKNPNVNMVLKGLRNLEAKLEKNRLKENCEDSNEEVEETDVESSQDEQFFFH
ncbi:hypothetical protein MTO96_019580 [Rhipicephalus appendiculatus]